MWFTMTTKVLVTAVTQVEAKDEEEARMLARVRYAIVDPTEEVQDTYWVVSEVDGEIEPSKIKVVKVEGEGEEEEIFED